MITWPLFRDGISDTRFDISLFEFSVDVNYVTRLIGQGDIQLLANSIMNAAVVAVRVEPEHALQALSLALNSERKAPDESPESETAYIALSYGHPIYDFVLQVGPTIARIRKRRTTLEDLVRSLPTLTTLSEGLFVEPKPPGGLPTLRDLMDLNGRIHRISWSFKLRLRLQQFVTEPRKDATNLDLVNKLVRTVLPPGVEHPERHAPLAGLNPEKIYRTDVAFGFQKTIGQQKYSLWVNYEGPYNVTQKDVDMEFVIRTEGPVDVDQLTNFETPIVDFYRDLILNRLLPSLFYDIRVGSRS